MKPTKHILNRQGNYKSYIYKTDIRKYLQCGDTDATSIFDKVKEYEKETLLYETFENRVPQDLFHEFRLKRRK